MRGEELQPHKGPRGKLIHLIRPEDGSHSRRSAPTRAPELQSLVREAVQMILASGKALTIEDICSELPAVAPSVRKKIQRFLLRNASIQSTRPNRFGGKALYSAKPFSA